jgi:fatty-acyl-CoA synthase
VRREALRARSAVREPVTLSGFLARSAEEYGGRPFVITDERTASYVEIDRYRPMVTGGSTSTVAVTWPSRVASSRHC